MFRLRLQQLESELEHQNSISDSLSQIASVLQSTISLLSPQSDSLALSSSSSSSSPLPLEFTKQQDKATKEENVEKENLSKHAKDTKLWSKTLRVGSEGDEVQHMQEDMEYSSFSSGTDVAVKTWQSSLGIPEDGIMTDELLKRLYSAEVDVNSNLLVFLLNTASVLQSTISLLSPQSDSLALSSSSSSSSPLPLEFTKQQDRTTKEENVEKENLSKHAKDTKLWSKTLRVGFEGDEVQHMQEDMEYSSFSSGTDVAVKTWQSSLGIPEDGIMTDELFKRLYSVEVDVNSNLLVYPKGKKLRFCIQEWLSLIGIGFTIGARVYILVGTTTREHSGPTLAFSFLIAGIAVALSPFCYAELTSRYPSIGSAYHYSYICVRESVAWIIGWALNYILPSTMAILVDAFDIFGNNFFSWLSE